MCPIDPLPPNLVERHVVAKTSSDERELIPNATDSTDEQVARPYRP